MKILIKKMLKCVFIYAYLLCGCTSYKLEYVPLAIYSGENLSWITTSSDVEAVSVEGVFLHIVHDISPRPTLSEVFEIAIERHLIQEPHGNARLHFRIIDAKLLVKNQYTAGTVKLALLVECQFIINDKSETRTYSGRFFEQSIPAGFNGLDYIGQFNKYMDAAAKSVAVSVRRDLNAFLVKQQ